MPKMVPGKLMAAEDHFVPSISPTYSIFTLRINLSNSPLNQELPEDKNRAYVSSSWFFSEGLAEGCIHATFLSPCSLGVIFQFSKGYQPGCNWSWTLVFIISLFREESFIPTIVLSSLEISLFPFSPLNFHRISANNHSRKLLLSDFSWKILINHLTSDTAPMTDHSNDCTQVYLGKSMNVIGVSYRIMGKRLFSRARETYRQLHLQRASSPNPTIIKGYTS